MKGVTCKKVGDMYHFEFDTYSNMLAYINIKRPSQISLCFDGEKLTAAIPVSSYTVRENNEHTK